MLKTTEREFSEICLFYDIYLHYSILFYIIFHWHALQLYTFRERKSVFAFFVENTEIYIVYRHSAKKIQRYDYFIHIAQHYFKTELIIWICRKDIFWKPRLCLFKIKQNPQMTKTWGVDINPYLSKNEPLRHVTDFDRACHV